MHASEAHIEMETSAIPRRTGEDDNNNQKRGGPKAFHAHQTLTPVMNITALTRLSLS